MDKNQFQPPSTYYLKEIINRLLKRFSRESASRRIIFVIGLIVIFHIIFFSPPYNFPKNKIINIEEGWSLDRISSHLKESGLIRSEKIFKFLAYISFNQTDLASGDYFFNKRENIFSLLHRLANAKYYLTAEVVTFPEGSTVVEISRILKEKFPNFNQREFLEISKDKEGFLFPDTYHFLPSIKARDVVSVMEKNFRVKTESLLREVDESGKSLKEIVIMASILEEEARTKETRDIISGILWKRIEIDMPLQVDAVFPYIIGKDTYELTTDDLKYDSPYNTYKYKGLPPGPISNPGLSSIESALRPVSSNYLFYLSDKEGNMHYAKDFETHKLNKQKYIY
jgi:UPF0755 protein